MAQSGQEVPPLSIALFARLADGFHSLEPLIQGSIQETGLKASKAKLLRDRELGLVTFLHFLLSFVIHFSKRDNLVIHYNIPVNYNIVLFCFFAILQCCNDHIYDEIKLNLIQVLQMICLLFS